jgi:hypothetical protein
MDERFEALMMGYIENNHWDNYEIDDDLVSIEFEAESGNTQTIYCSLHEDTVEFDIPSAIVYDSLEQVDINIAMHQLTRNSQLRIGFWVLEEIEDKFCFSLMWNMPLEMLEVLNDDWFSQSIFDMIMEVDLFEQKWAPGETDTSFQSYEELKSQGLIEDDTVPPLDEPEEKDK